MKVRFYSSLSLAGPLRSGAARRLIKKERKKKLMNLGEATEIFMDEQADRKDFKMV